LVPGLVPAREITMLSGDGGTGKSLLALQLAVSYSAGSEWAGQVVLGRGRALFISAEDSIEELHRRLGAIIRTHRELIDAEGLKSLDLLSLAGCDAVLAAPKIRDGILIATRLFEAIEVEVDNLRPGFLVLDTLADLFGGDEIKRPHARQFINLLRGLAIKFNLTILLLSHPSLSGMTSGAGTSGSTAWSNSVRSRLYLESPKGEDDDASDDRRILTTKKANYGRAGGSVALRWENGVFVVDRASTAEQMQTNIADESVFLDILAAFDRAGRHVSEKRSSTYAPNLFAADPQAKGVSKKRLEAAMERLFSSNCIHVETSGPASRRRGKIAAGPTPEAAK
jgi:RecA-family ATPase